MIEKIRQSEDAVLLAQLNKLMDISTLDEQYILSKDQVNTVQLAEDQIKYRESLTHEEAKN